MNWMFRALIPSATLALSACGAGSSEAPPLAGARIGGPFTLVNQDGKTVHDSDFAGKYRIVYFGYTYCPDVCPTDLTKIGAALRTLDKQAPATAAKIVPLFITVDPERDTLPVLVGYTAAFDPRIVGLSGSPAQIEAAANAYRIYYAKRVIGDDYFMDHTSTVHVVRPDGAHASTFLSTASPSDMARQMRKLLGGG